MTAARQQHLRGSAQHAPDELLKTGRGRWVEVSHAQVDVELTDAADLWAQLDRFSQTDKWGLVVATKQDLGMRIIHHQHNRIDTGV
jgi:hypothetical protein